MRTLGERIKAIRKLKGLTQEDVAHLLNIAVTNYSKIERDEADIRMSRLSQIAEVFKLTVQDIFNFDDALAKEVLVEKLLNFKIEFHQKETEIFHLIDKYIDIIRNDDKPAT